MISRLVAAFFSLILTLFLLSIGLVGLLVLTTGGARWLADWAMELEPRLTLTVDSGALASDLTISGFAWNDDAIKVSATQAELAWSPDCLLTARLCLDRISLTGLRVDMQPGTDATGEDEAHEAEPAVKQAQIQLPLSVQLRLLQLNDSQVNLPDMQFALKRLQASAGFSGSTFTLEWLRASGLDIAITTPAETAPAEPKQPLSEFRLDLPSIELPLDLVFRNLILENSSFKLDENHLDVRQLMLSAALRGSQLKVDRIELDAGPVAAELSGNVALTGNYPLSAQLNARLRSPDLPEPLVVELGAKGSLGKLALAVDLKEPQLLHADASVRLLTPGLPFELLADWQQLAYPLEGDPIVVLQDGELEAKGDLSGYAGKLSVKLAGREVPDGDWRLRFSGDDGQLQIQELTAALLAGELKANGLLQWREGVSWQATLDARKLNPGEQWPDLPGLISGQAEVSGQLDESGLAFAFSTSGIEGHLRDYPLDVRGSLSKSADDRWSFEQLRLLSGSNRLDIDGQLTDHWNLQGSARLGDAAELLPDLKGRGSAEFSLQGLAAEPDMTLELQVSDLRYQEYSLAKSELHLDLRRLGLEQSSLQWGMHKLKVGEQQLSKVQAELRGDRARHELTITADGADLGGDLKLQGGLDEHFNWVGQLLSAHFKLPPGQRWTLADTVAMDWQQAQRQLSIAAHCWRQKDSSLCLTEAASLGEKGSIQLALSDFHLEWLTPWMPDGLRWKAPLNAKLMAQWQGGEPPTVKAEVNSRKGIIALEQDDNAPIELAYERIGLVVSLEQSALDAALELESDQLGTGRLALQTRLGPEETRPLSGEVDLKGLQLGLVGAFLPDIQRLDGVISASGRLGGSLQDPQFRGNVRLVDGEVIAANLPMNLADIQVQADIKGSDAKLQGSFRSGDGSAELDGSASWSGETWQLALGLKGESLRVVYQPLAQLEVSPDLKLSIQPQQVLVEGRVLIPKGKITLKELPEGAVGVSEDVVVIRRSEPLSEDEGTPAENWRITLDIELALGNSVQIEGFGLTGRLGGELRMRQRPGGVPEAAGDLRIIDGRYKAYGQNLEIRQGQLLFSGPITQPSLNIEAVRRVDNVVAGLRIEGEPESPQVTLFSEPGLPQEEILSYLIRGRPLDSEGAGSDQLLAQAALSLGIFGGKGFASSLASELGVEEFEVGTAGEGDETQVELSGYLTPDLLVRYGIGVFEPVNTLTLRYRINKNFFVEAVSGLESALDFFYQFEF